MSDSRRRVPPALVLFTLAPAIGELLSGSSPPVEFFKPFSLLLLAALYGGGALLVRETALRWGKRWPTILVLGLAYGILEEGLMVKSFFDPSWMDLGLLGIYGRWAGVNWVWAVLLTLYHAVVSIALPILLVEILFPGRRDDPWLGRRGMRTVGILLAIDVVFANLFLTPYRPPFAPYALAVVATVALVFLAHEQPARWGKPESKPRWGSFRLGLLGFLGITALFFGGWAMPELGFPAPLTIAFILLAALGSWRLIRWASGEGAWDDRGRLALAAGVLTFFILLAFAAETDPSRADNPAGMSIVGLAAVAGLAALYMRVRQRVQSDRAAGAP
ncbi:MAG: hypothetical protein P8X64_06100 [Anaerolineales bacterium]|jgi:hypothetical protein